MTICLLQSVNYKKFSDASALKVTFYGGLRSENNNCNCLWYFTFNGMECQHPNVVQGNEYHTGGVNAQEEEGSPGDNTVFLLSLSITYYILVKNIYHG